jgi:hypothetical protein
VTPSGDAALQVQAVALRLHANAPTYATFVGIDDFGQIGGCTFIGVLRIVLAYIKRYSLSPKISIITSKIILKYNAFYVVAIHKFGKVCQTGNTI